MLRYILTIVATIIIACVYLSNILEFSDDELVWHQSSRREDNEKMNTKHTLSPRPYCPSDGIRNHLNCTDWLNDALESMAIVHGSLVTNGNKNATDVKLCQSTLDIDIDSSIRSAGFKVPEGVVIVKCNKALVEFRFWPPNGKISCGIEPLSKLVDPDSIHKNIDAILATDLNYGNSIQHDPLNGLSLSSIAWNVIKESKSNLHVIAGEPLKDLWIELVGEDKIYTYSGGKQKWWFENLYLSPVPTSINFRSTEHLPRSVISIANHIEYKIVDSDHSLPCSTHSMLGFQEWRSNYTKILDEKRSIDDKNGTLVYLQRTHRRYHVYYDCSGSIISTNDTSCDCSSVSEDEFVERLDTLSKHHGLDLVVFHHKTLKEDAEVMSKARVVIGPHGGAFSNILFLNPDSLIIETNLQREVYDNHPSKYKEPPRAFYTHYAASLGHRYWAYQPHVWREYSVGDMRISIELNDYLDFVDKAISGEDVGALQTSAPSHPCVSMMV